MLLGRYLAFGFIAACFAVNIAYGASADDGAAIFHSKLFGAAPPASADSTASDPGLPGAEIFHAALFHDGGTTPTLAEKNPGVDR